MTIHGVVKGAIQNGLLVLVAVEEADTAEDIEWLSEKIVRLRIFNDDSGVMNRSVQEVNDGILLISQFTLFASTRKGNRPSYLRSALRKIPRPFHAGFWPPGAGRRIRRRHARPGRQRRAGHNPHGLEGAGINRWSSAAIGKAAFGRNFLLSFSLALITLSRAN